MGVTGLFHTDELPNYGITQEEVDSYQYPRLKYNNSQWSQEKMIQIVNDAKETYDYKAFVFAAAAETRFVFWFNFITESNEWNVQVVDTLTHAQFEHYNLHLEPIVHTYVNITITE